jgi:hypothetical protein
MPTKKKDNSIDPNQNKYIAEKEYQYAVSLMQYATTLLWQQFGVFMLVQTIIIGNLAKALTDKHNLIVVIGSVLGFLICIPWHYTLEHNHKTYLLRMEQAKRHEKILGVSLFTEGKKEYDDSKIPLWLRPYSAFRLLIKLFAVLFGVLLFVAIRYQ